MAVGRADDSTGKIEEDFLERKEALFFVFAIDLRFPQKKAEHDPSLSVIEDDCLISIDLYNGVPIPLKKTNKAALMSLPIQPQPVGMAKEHFMTPSRSCLHLELDLTQFPEMKYKTGDHLAVCGQQIPMQRSRGS